MPSIAPMLITAVIIGIFDDSGLEVGINELATTPNTLQESFSLANKRLKSMKTRRSKLMLVDTHSTKKSSSVLSQTPGVEPGLFSGGMRHNDCVHYHVVY